MRRARRKRPIPRPDGVLEAHIWEDFYLMYLAEKFGDEEVDVYCHEFDD
jgi:hypothetical protein